MDLLCLFTYTIREWFHTYISIYRRHGIISLFLIFKKFFFPQLNALNRVLELYAVILGPYFRYYHTFITLHFYFKPTFQFLIWQLYFFINLIYLCFYYRERKCDDAEMSLFCVAIFKMIISCQQLELEILANTLLQALPSAMFISCMIMSQFLCKYNQYLMVVRKPPRLNDFYGSLINILYETITICTAIWKQLRFKSQIFLN